MAESSNISNIEYKTIIAKAETLGDGNFAEGCLGSTANFIVPADKLDELFSFVKATRIKQPVPIHSLGSDKYSLVAPLFVTLVQQSNCIEAGILELNLVGFGRDEVEALDDLKLNIIDLFDELKELGVDKLGSDPRKWLLLLKEYIRET